MTAASRALLTDEVKDAFRGAGLSHVLVVSGLHLSAVGGLVYAAVRRMGRRRLACACAMFSSLAFMPHGFYTLCCARGYGNAAALRGH